MSERCCRRRFDPFSVCVSLPLSSFCVFSGWDFVIVPFLCTIIYILNETKGLQGYGTANNVHLDAMLKD